jgi:hypothetical protein
MPVVLLEKIKQALESFVLDGNGFVLLLDLMSIEQAAIEIGDFADFRFKLGIPQRRTESLRGCRRNSFTTTFLLLIWTESLRRPISSASVGNPMVSWPLNS